MQMETLQILTETLIPGWLIFSCTDLFKAKAGQCPYFIYPLRYNINPSSNQFVAPVALVSMMAVSVMLTVMHWSVTILASMAR